MHPVGPHSSAVYWVRRVILIVIAVALVIGLVWWMTARAGADSAGANTETTADTAPVAGPTTGTLPVLTGVLAVPTLSDDIYDDVPDDEAPADGDEADAAADGTGPVTISGSDAPVTSASPDEASADESTPATTDKAPKKKDKKADKDVNKKDKKDKKADKKKAVETTETTSKKTPKTTAPPKPSYDASGRLICADDSISIAGITWGDSYPVGSQPRLGMAVTNTGSKTCVRDLSGSLQTYTVYTAKGDRVWSTDDCFPGEGTEIRQLAPGSTANFIIVWAGTTSEPGCSAPRTPVTAGKYVLVAKLGALKSKKHPFEIR